jgi:membrane fusion protein, macrolide-specific efflux system
MSTKTRRRRWPWGVALVCVAGAALALVVRSRASAAPLDESKLVSVERRDLSVEILEVGRVEAEHRVELKSKVRGLVDKVYVTEGDRVKVGQPLLRLDPVDYARDVARARADVARAKNAYELSELRASRATFGAGQGIVSQADLEAAIHEREEKRLDLVANRVALAAARDRVRATRIVAPIDGTIVQRGTEPGQAVTPGVESSYDAKPLLTIADLSRLLVKVDLNQIDVAKTRVGQKVEIGVDALPDRRYHAEVTRIAPASEKRPGKDVEVFPVEARLLDADERIKPGMTAEVRILVQKKPRVVALPIETLKKEQGKTLVTRARIGAKGLERENVEVVVGARNDREAEIISGLQPGDRVLIDPPSAAANETKL